MPSSMSKKIDLKELVERIARLTRERIVSEDVVSLDNYKNFANVKIPPTVLLIEDDDTQRKSLQRILTASGYRVLAAASGAELSTVVGESVIDLILLDVGLPWINGFELAQMMKEHRDLQNVPFVFISAQSDIDTMKKGFRVGAHDFIRKPFEITTVQKTVHTLLKLSGVLE